MTIRDIAGFCPEEAIWKMMVDVSSFLLKDEKSCFLSPDSVTVDGSTFIVESDNKTSNEFLAPEYNGAQKPDTKQMIWSLGAIAYYMATGHIVFGGHGGSYQKEHSSILLPILPKGLQALTPVLHKCLCYDPKERINLKDLKDLSFNGWGTCEKQQRERTIVVKENTEKVICNLDEKWPEKMTGI